MSSELAPISLSLYHPYPTRRAGQVDLCDTTGLAAGRGRAAAGVSILPVSPCHTRRQWENAANIGSHWTHEYRQSDQPAGLICFPPVASPSLGPALGPAPLPVCPLASRGQNNSAHLPTESTAESRSQAARTRQLLSPLRQLASTRLPRTCRRAGGDWGGVVFSKAAGGGAGLF